MFINIILCCLLILGSCQYQINPLFISGSDTADPNPSYSLPYQIGGRGDGFAMILHSDNISLYVFGGIGNDMNGLYNGYMNDLWVFNLNTLQWTFLNGSKSNGQKTTSSIIGARKCHTMSHNTQTNTLYVFGGYGIDFNNQPGTLNDLWAYNISSSNWTLVSGSTSKDAMASYTTPTMIGAKYAHSMIYNPNDNCLYVFGGQANNVYSTQVTFNELWKYDITTNIWIFLYGAKGLNQISSYNNPFSIGSRSYSSMIYSQSKNSLIIFGGTGFTNTNSYSVDLNDVWMYDLTLMNWKYISGSTLGNQWGSYTGPYTIGGRNEFSLVYHPNEFLIVFGGFGFDSNGLNGPENDLWAYDFNSANWAFLNGGQVTQQNGSYTSPTKIGSRSTQNMVLLPNNSLIIFGGTSYDKIGNYGKMNDMWRIDMAKVCNVGYYGIFCNNSCSCVTGTCNNNVLENYSCTPSSSSIVSSSSSKIISSSSSSISTSSASMSIITVNITTFTMISNVTYSATNINVFSTIQFFYSNVVISDTLNANGSNILFQNSTVMIGSLYLQSLNLTMDLNTMINVSCLNLKNVTILLDLKNEDISPLKKNNIKLISFPPSCSSVMNVNLVTINAKSCQKTDFNHILMAVTIKDCDTNQNEGTKNNYSITIMMMIFVWLWWL
jgi:N-acetylneuraminic acid mutarotase